MKSFSENIIHFHRNLVLPEHLPEGVEVMNPFAETETLEVASKFYHKYYNDNKERKLILGINPGRFGAGLTGVPFTDPIKLEQYCGIENDLQKKPELSAEFIWKVIDACGGPERFFSKIYINSAFPLGFTKGGKNLNYYDIPALQKIARPISIAAIRQQLDFGINREVAYCLGEGQNYKYLKSINEECGFFKELIPLPHPRFIMQYRRKFIDSFVKRYFDSIMT